MIIVGIRPVDLGAHGDLMSLATPLTVVPNSQVPCLSHKKEDTRISGRPLYPC